MIIITSVKVDYDFGSNRVLPGFIDIHTHGAYGYIDTKWCHRRKVYVTGQKFTSELSFLPTTDHSNWRSSS